MTELMDDEASDVRDLLARALDVDPPLDGLRGHDVATAYRHRTRLRRAALGAATVATSALIAVPFALTGDLGLAAVVAGHPRGLVGVDAWLTLVSPAVR